MVNQWPCRVGLAWLLAMLTACGGKPPPLVLSDWRVSRPIISAAPVVAYGRVQHAHTATVWLQGVASPAATEVQIHRHQIVGDTQLMQMQQLSALALDPQHTFASGGDHLMLFEVALSSGQRTVPLVFTVSIAGVTHTVATTATLFAR